MVELAYEGGELALFAAAKNWKRYLADVLEPYLRGHVLEVGAGIGATTRALTQASGVREWTAIEPDRELLAQLTEGANELTRARGFTVRALSGTLLDLPSRPEFDTILYIDVLEHIEDDLRELSYARERLREGGHIVVLAPAHQALYSEFDRQVGHHRRYDRRSLRALTPSGTRLVALRYLDSVGVMASLANRLLLRAALPSKRQIGFWDGVLVPASRVLDSLTRGAIGKSVLAVFQR